LETLNSPLLLMEIGTNSQADFSTTNKLSLRTFILRLALQRDMV
jgi:hypothetical protein